MADSEAKSARAEFDAFSFMARFAPLIFLLLLMAAFTIVEPRFLNPLNITNVLRQVSIYGLLAIGMTFVILTAGIDLSVGAVLAFSGMVAAVIAKGGLESRFAVGAETEAAGFGWGLAMLGSILVGMACGGLQGLAVTRLKVPPFVVTLGGMSAFRGATLLLSGGGPVSGFSDGYTMWGKAKIAQDLLGSWAIPAPVLIFLSFAVLAHVVLRYSRFGRHVYAVGGNPEAARLAGLNVRGIVTSVYLIIGFFAGLGGFVLSARLGSSEAVAGLAYELTVIASVVIGGTSLFGGVGAMSGTVTGVILIGVLLNGLQLNNVSPYIQQIIIGVIIVLAVAFDTFAKSRRRRA